MIKINRPFVKGLAILFALLLVAPQLTVAQSAGEEKPFKQEELDQILAPLALYPDSLVSQILMASTYPLEVVQAARWAEANKSLQEDALTAALEKQTWDPSVKSLVNFPQVLQMMDEKLDWTQKLGDAFLAQQKEVMDTIQSLRKKAQAEGNLNTTQEQKVIVEKETQTIIIESADPQVIYVPTYNPTVVYGAWPYPAYPPYYYYPPGYTAGAAWLSFGMGVAAGAAWGYAWGHCGWGHGEVDVDINRNTNINNNINRGNYSNRVSQGQGGRGSWKHNPESRRGVSYRDQGTAQKYDRGASRNAQSRESFRGRSEAGRQDLARGGADQFRGGSGGGRQGTQAGRDTGSLGRSPSSQQTRQSGGFERSGASQRSNKSAFGGYERGSRTQSYSDRGRQSMSSSRGSGGSSRGGGGMSRGGGGRGGGRR